MEPVSFPEHNRVFAKDQPQYKPLPVFIATDDPYGTAVSCWRLSFRERLRILFSGKLWLSMLTFHKPLTPVFPTTKKSDVIQTES